MVFLLLPIVAIFAHTSPAELVAQLGNPVVRDAFLVSIKTSLIAQALILIFGTPAAFLLASRRFPGHALAITLVELPLVLPPAVAGIGLLAAFGRLGLLGSSLDAFGISLPFTPSPTSPARSTSARRSPPSRRPTPIWPPRRARSAPVRSARSSG
jgi:molybdate transport system permease protein